MKMDYNCVRAKDNYYHIHLPSFLAGKVSKTCGFNVINGELGLCYIFVKVSGSVRSWWGKFISDIQLYQS